MQLRSTRTSFALRQRSNLVLLIMFLVLCAGVLPTHQTSVHAAPLPAPIATLQDLHGLFAVSMHSATNGWIVGADRTALHWNGAYWRPVPVPSHVNFLYDVTTLSATDAWAVAGEGQSGVVLRWNGSTWQPIGLAQPTTAPRTITMLSPMAGWVGGFGGVQHWNGVNWSKDLLIFEAYASAALSPTDVWIGGSRLYRYNGTTRTQYDNKGIIAQGIMFSSPTDGWLAGNVITFCHEDHCSYEAGTAHWDGTSWTGVAVPNPYAYLSEVWASPTSGTWAVGENLNRGYILRWNGSNWLEVPIPEGVGPIYDIAMVSVTDGWAISWTGEILRWNGSQWNIWTVDLEHTYIPLTIGA